MDEENKIVTIPPFPKKVSLWSLCCFVPYQVLAWIFYVFFGAYSAAE